LDTKRKARCEMHKQFPFSRCPKCGRLLSSTGEVTLDGEHTLPVYECDAPTCTKLFRFEGDEIQAPLTWAVTADGRAVEIPLDD
jgi:hypothetical protein